jgi:fatty-acyl-CoA synthase
MSRMTEKPAFAETIDLPVLFDQAAETFGAAQSALIAYRSAQVDGPRTVWSRRALAGDIRRTAVLMQSRGLKTDERVALLLPTIPEIHPLLWGGMAVSGVALINPLLQVEHILHLLDEVDAKLLCVPTAVLSGPLAAVATVIADARPDLQLLTVGPGGEFPACLADVVEIEGSTFERRSDAHAALFHTGGTTGRPKIAPLTLANLLHAVNSLTPCLAYRPEDRFFSPLPLFHIAGAIVGGLAPFLSGTTVIMPAPAGLRDPTIVQQCWKLLERERATMMVAVPTSLAALCNVPLDGVDLSHLEYVLTGTAPLPDETGRRFSALTAKQVHTGYGMTETAGVIAYAPRHQKAMPATVGQPLQGVKVKIDPLSSSDPSLGRVMVRGPNVFSGYLGHPKRIVDVWMDTGDLGFFDDDGWLTLTGRSKDLIIRGGHNIDPAVIEEAATRHHAVVVAAAIGQIDDYAGEVPVLYVQLKPESDEQAVLAELAAFLEKEIAEPPARPKAIHAIGAIPTTAVGKIYKPALRLDAAYRRIDRLFKDYAVNPISLSAKDDVGGMITIYAELAANDSSRKDELSGLIARFPVKVQLAVRGEQAI